MELYAGVRGGQEERQLEIMIDHTVVLDVQGNETSLLIDFQNAIEVCSTLKH